MHIAVWIIPREWLLEKKVTSPKSWIIITIFFLFQSVNNCPSCFIKLLIQLNAFLVKSHMNHTAPKRNLKLNNQTISNGGVFTTTAMTDLIQKPSSGISPSSTTCHTQLKQTNIGQWKFFEINKRCNQNNIYICICYDHVFSNLGIFVSDTDIQFLHFAQLRVRQWMLQIRDGTAAFVILRPNLGVLPYTYGLQLM